MSPISAVPRAPYALEPTEFPFPALAAMAGRAALGGPREVALACFLVARVVADAIRGDTGLTSDQVRVRIQGSRHWLGAAALPGQVKSSLSRLAEAAQGGDRSAIKSALDSVMTVTASHLDPGARLELGRLAQTVAE